MTILSLVVALAFWPIYPVAACTWVLWDKLRIACRGEFVEGLVEKNVHLCCADMTYVSCVSTVCVSCCH